jgi:hypothetical protein
MREVEDAVRGTGRRPVGRDVAQPNGDEGRRPVHRQLQLDDRRAEDLEPFCKDRGVECERAPVVFALVARELGPPADYSVIEPPRLEREIRTEAMTGETVITNYSGAGRFRLNWIDLETTGTATDSVGITEGDPLSCWAESHRTSEQKRDGWHIRLEGTVRLTSTHDDFLLTGSLEAYENEQLVFETKREAVIPRDHV